MDVIPTNQILPFYSFWIRHLYLLLPHSCTFSELTLSSLLRGYVYFLPFLLSIISGKPRTYVYDKDYPDLRTWCYTDVHPAYPSENSDLLRPHAYPHFPTPVSCMLTVPAMLTAKLRNFECLALKMSCSWKLLLMSLLKEI
jgi:hypothetical protein